VHASRRHAAIDHIGSHIHLQPSAPKPQVYYHYHYYHYHYYHYY